MSEQKTNMLAEEGKESPGFLNIIIILLSLYVIGVLIADTFLTFSPEISKLLRYIDNVCCVFFLYDFIHRFIQAENKWKYMKWGWIDLISSIPTIDFLRAGRVIKIVRLFRLIRAFRSLRFLMDYFLKEKTQGALTSASVIAILMIIFSSIAILQVENVPESNIQTAEDAIWWAYVTITTVGYGDRFPVTTEGRLIAVALMTVGVGLFGTFTAFLASWFVGDNKSKSAGDTEKNAM